MTTPATSGGNPFRAILDVGAALVSSLDLETVFANVAQRIGEAMMVSGVDIQTYDRERGKLIYEAYWSVRGVTDEDRSYIGTVTDIAERPDWARITELGEMVEQHVDDASLPAVDRESMRKWGYKSTLDAPLAVGGQVIGLMGLSENRFVRRFTAIERDLFAQLCDLAAVAIHNAQVFRMQQEQARHMDALIDASRAITSSVDLDEVLHTVAEKATGALGTSECVIYEHDEAHDCLVWRAMYPMDDYGEVKEREGTEYPLDDNPSDRQILAGGIVVAESISDRDLPEDVRASMEKWHEKTCVNVPLMFEGRALGIMVLIETSRERELDDDERDLVLALGEQAALAIRKAQIYERQQQEARRVRSLLDASRAIASTVDLDTVLAHVSREACFALGVDATSIYEYDGRKDLYAYRAKYEAAPNPRPDENDDSYLGMWYDLNAYPGDRAIMLSDRPVVHHLSDPDLPEDRRAAMERYDEQTVLNVPLSIGDERFGIVRFYVYGRERQFTEDEIGLARGIVEQAAVAVSNARQFEATARQKDRLGALLDAGRAIGSSVDLEEVLRIVTREACLALNVPATSVYEYDASSDRYAYRSVYNTVPSPAPDDDLGTWYDMADYPGDRVIMLSDVPVVHHLSDPDLAPDRRSYMEEFDEQTVLNVPLRFGDERLGIVRYYVYEHERRFTNDEIELASGIAEQAALAIVNARLFDRQREEARRVQALLEAGKAIGSTVDLDEVLARVTREACHALDVAATAVYEHDVPGDGYVYRGLYEAVPSPSPDDSLGTWYALADYPGERAIMLSDVPLVHHLSDPDLAPDRRRNMEEFDEHTVINVPLRFGDQRLGVLRFYVYGAERHFSDGEIELARGLGEQAAIAMANAALYQRVARARARTDTLLDASRALATSLEPREVFAAITRQAAEALGSPRCAIYEYDGVADTLAARAFFEPIPTPGYNVLDVPEPVDRRPGDRVILAGDKVVVETLSDERLDPATRAEMEFWNEATAINAPLVFRGEALGILMILFTGDERIVTADDETLAAALAEQAAAAIYNARLYERVQRERERTAALFEASRTLTSTLVREEVFALVTQRAAATFGSPRCDLYEYDGEADTLTLRGYHEEVPSGLYTDSGGAEPMDDRPGDREILERGEIVVQHVSDDAVDAITRTEMVEWGERTCLNVPVIVKGEPLGLLIITETAKERRFTDDEIELARGLGEQVGMALQNARLYARLEVQNRRLLNLLQSSREMTGSMDVEKAVATMCTEIAGLLDCPVCHIDVGLRDESGSYVLPEVVAAPESAGANAEPALVPDAVAEQALSERQPVQSHDETGGGSRLVIPLLAKDEPSGFVELSGPLHASFGNDELEVVQILANQAAVAIDNARLLQDRERQAITDGLTGLYNHRFFYDRLRSEMARSLRYFTPISLLLLDVDDFKSFNDTYGHMAGDEVLRNLGRLLTQGVRNHVDIPCRYGGEEFAVILPNTPVPGARAVGKRLQGQVANVDDPAEAGAVPEGLPAGADGSYAGPDRRGAGGEGSDSNGESGAGVPQPVANPDGAAIVGERIRHIVESATFTDTGGSPLRTVTVSIGVAAFPEHAVNVDDLVAAADKALYLAKESGKNRVVVSEFTI